MSRYIVAHDLGTGGNKATIYNEDGNCIANAFESYNTYYSSLGYHEQRPLDWWNAVIKSTRKIISKSKINKKKIEAISLSGHSLGTVPVGKDGELLLDKTPIWSDTRAKKQAESFFNNINELEWYKKTGNGFTRECYTVFKILWYKDNLPELFKRIYKIIGTKDFINFKLTGNIYTDFSYASGSGVYNLIDWDYSPELMKDAKLSFEIFPEIIPSTNLVGQLNKDASQILGLDQNVKVFCGGVDNSCMALGAKNISEGRLYTNLGSSAWIAISSSKPIIDETMKPFIFAHVIPGMYISSFGTFSAGSSFKWIKENLCGNILKNIKTYDRNPYEIMIDYAKKSGVGSNNLIFNPSLAGGSKAQPSPNIRGALIGLDLSHSLSDIIRASMEGIAMDLKILLNKMSSLCNLPDEVLLVGGGSKSKLWRQIFADIYNKKIIKTNVDQNAAALGAAGVAAIGLGIWKDFKRIDKIHIVKDITTPMEKNVKYYKKLLNIYKYARESQAKIGDMLNQLN